MIDKNQLGIVEELEALFSRFLALSPGLALVLALWSVATTSMSYSMPSRIWLSPRPQNVVARRGFGNCSALSASDPLLTVSITAATLYRLLKARKRTLLIDEAEYLGKRNDERGSLLREILNAGHRKGQSVLRCKQTTTRRERVVSLNMNWMRSTSTVQR